jgi:hypothetical protein
VKAAAKQRAPLPLTGSCHCGDVRFELLRRPRGLTRCNCSVCRRYGTLWAYFTWKSVRMVKARGAAVAYQRRQVPTALRFVHCARCGCVTHWEYGRTPESRVALNMRLLEDPSALDGVKVKWLDGAGRFETVANAGWP